MNNFLSLSRVICFGVILNGSMELFGQEKASDFELTYGNNKEDLDKLRQDKSNPVVFNFNCSCRGEVVLIKNKLDVDAKVMVIINIGEDDSDQYLYAIDLPRGTLKPIGLTFGCYTKDGKTAQDVESNRCRSFTYEIKRI